MTDFYRAQRSMRHMRRTAMQRGVIAILDVGSSKVACLILRFDGEVRPREADGVGPMAGQSSFRIIGAATTRSRGVRFGEIVQMNETERAIRTAVPTLPFLVPGIGEQGGDLEGVLAGGLTRDGNGLLISSSRGIIYAGGGEAAAIRAAAETLHRQINALRRR